MNGEQAPYLRARRRTPAPNAPAGAPSQSNSSVADFLSGRSQRPGRAEPNPPVAQSSSLDLSRPASTPTASNNDPLNLDRPASSDPTGGNPLDLGGGQTTPPAQPGRNPLDLGGSDAQEATPNATSAARGNPLDLGTSGPPAQPSRGIDFSRPGRPSASAGSSLDLSSPAPPPAAAPTSRRHTALVSHELGLPTIAEGERRILTIDDPVAHLTRMQSSSGALEIQAATAQPNQLLLGCLFETRDERENAVLPGLHPQGPDPSSPIFRATTQGVTVNLRAVTEVSRFFVIGLPQTADRAMPGGTLVITTYGGSRLEVVLDTSATFGAKALVTGYVVEGRIVLRAEHDPFSGTLQQVAGVYGYDQMTWRDPFTPLF